MAFFAIASLFIGTAFASSGTKELCGTNSDGETLKIATLSTYLLENGNYRVVLEYSKDFNDNTYGTNAVNWPGDNHKYKHLLSSDMAEFSLKNADGNEVLHFQVDYFEDGQNTTSGYGTRIQSGNSAYILEHNSSLSKNFNDYGYILTENSPATDGSYSPNPTYPNWIYEMTYEFIVDKAAFGSAGFGEAIVVNAHNSPAKNGFDNSTYPEYCEPSPEECNGEIGNLIWLDYSGEGSSNNCNGIQDSGEPGIANVTVLLKDIYDNTVATTTTDANGLYSFSINDLCNAYDCNDCDGKVKNLTLRYDGSSAAQIKVTQKDGTIVFNNSVQAGANFSFVGSDKHNTLGTEITLFVGGQENTKIHTSCSQPIGPGLVKGSFTVISGQSLNGGALCPINGSIINACFNIEVDASTLPAGYTPTAIMVGTDEELDNNGSPADVCLTESKLTDHSIDFGYCPPVECTNSIGNKVWHDKDLDGKQDAGEEGIPNVTVELLNGSGNLLETTATDINGEYFFDELNNATYKVRVAGSNFQDGGTLYHWYATAKDAGSNDEIDSDGDLNQHTATVSLNCEDNPTIDFGFFLVCLSLEKTGPTTAIPGQTITYTFTVTNCGDVTLGGGVQVFDLLLVPSGAKIWHETVYAGVTKTFTKTYTIPADFCGELINTASALGHPALSGRTIPDLTVSTSVSTNVVCEPDCDGSIGDKIWLDYSTFGNVKNCNGIQDPGEPGIAGVKLYLKDSQGSIIDSTISNQQGFYTFTALCDECYTIEVDESTLPAGVTPTATAVGNDRTKDSNGSPYEACVTENNRTITTVDFGYCNDCSGEIGDRVWLDYSGEGNENNCNGVQDANEPGIPNVKLYLKDSEGNIVAETTTNSVGYYKFQNVCEGTYTIEIVASTLPAGVTPTANGAGSDTGKDSNGSPANVSLTTDNSTDYTIDFGFCQPPCEGEIGDRVWLDYLEDGGIFNCNGIQDPGEPGIAGVTVYLTDDQGNILDTDITDQNGFYRFTNVCDGCYRVRVNESTLPDNYTRTAYGQGGNNAKDSNNQPAELCIVETHRVNLTIDFGYCVTCDGSIGDRVWLDFYENGSDKNCNGIQDNGEPGIPGVTINLKDSDGEIIETTITNAHGFYKFDNLCSGSYTIELDETTIPTGYTGSIEYAGTDTTKDGNASPFTVLLTDENLSDFSVDFGFCTTCCEWASIGDFVWNDENKDGIQDGSESGVQYVTVHLYDCSNTWKATTATDANGFYKFDHLVPGDYYVKFTLPANYAFSPKDAGGDDALDSDVNPATGKTTCTTLDANEYDATWDAGIYLIPVEELPDLKIMKSVDDSTVENGDQVTFTITVTNESDVNATGVIVKDYIPSGIILDGYNTSSGTFDDVSGVWIIGNVLANTSEWLTITATVNVTVPSSGAFQEFNLGIASDFNLFVLSDLEQPSSDTEGRVAVGRNATLGNYSVGDKLPDSGGMLDVLIVGNNLTYTSGAVLSGNVVYGNTTNLPINAVSIEGTLRQDDPIDFSAATIYLNNLSAQLAAYTVSGTVTEPYQSGLYLTGTDPYLNVFNVSGSVISNKTDVQIDVPFGSVALINIDGTNVSMSGGLLVKGTSYNNVLFNFYEADFLTISGIDVTGSILAPGASVNFTGGVQNGQMIAKCVYGTGQFNNSKFLGNIPGTPDITNSVEILSMDQDDSDSTPGNGVLTEDDYSTITVYVGGIDLGENGGSSSGGNEYQFTWEQVGSFNLSEIVYSLTSDVNGNILAGTWGGNIYRSGDEGATWSQINPNMNVAFIWSLAVNQSTIYVGTEQGLFISLDNGLSWSAAGLSGFDIRSIVIDRTNNVVYAAAWGFGVYASTDGGSTWTNVNGNLLNVAANSLTINSNAEVFVATLGTGVYKKSYGATSWTKVNVGSEFVWALGVTSEDVLYAGTYGNGLYQSLNGGTTWAKINGGLSATYIYSITVDAGDNVYVSSWESGVFVSTENNGSSWMPLGMSGAGVSSILINPTSDNLYAGTNDGKIFKKIDAQVTSIEEDTEAEELPTEYRLEQNFPNPFNPTTTIRFSVPETGIYTMKVFNILGQEVTSLLNEQLNVGTHNITFNATNLASGVYIYRLSGNNHHFVKKMVLLK